MKTPTPIADHWFSEQKWKPHKFQRECWEAILDGRSGLLNAPTGFGKTYGIWFGVLQQYFNQRKRATGLHCLWITPLRALSKEIYNATSRISNDLGLDYDIGLRTGDTTVSERQKQRKSSPQGMITTPESVHIILASKGYSDFYKNLQFVVIDEWHELMGSKRGVLVELALSRLKAINPKLQVWGISATIGNLGQAQEILLGADDGTQQLVRSDIKKNIVVETILPDEIEKYPWAGHLGIRLMDKVLEIIHNSQSTLVFTNMRSQCELWYQRLLDADVSLAGRLALHHGSLSEEMRQWVENALHDGVLKAVVCTSSLDLGVDFRPVDTVIQIGSPKGVARFMQRAGRSGHQPGATSKIYFLPTHSLEIIEGSACRHAIEHGEIEQRIPFIRSFDVLVQYLVTLAVSDGFRADEIYEEIVHTYSFSSVTREEFNWCLAFIHKGGTSLDAYDEYHKVDIMEGVYKVTSRKIAMQHRLSIGAIVSDTMVMVQYMGGKKIGMVEEWFVARMNPGDVFSFAGHKLELIRVKDMVAQVRKNTNKKGTVVSYQGGRMPLSSQLSSTIRHQLNEYHRSGKKDAEIEKLIPLFDEQNRRSHLPGENELLIEKIQTEEGHHVFVYPFEGRNVHEGMSALFAWRIAQIKPMSFSLAFNDYGFELLSDEDVPVEEALANGSLFDATNLTEDILRSVNVSEMARRRFRDIASIAGLVFNGYPGKQVKARHLQANSSLFFSVFSDHEKGNLLLQEAYDEVMIFQMEQVRMQEGLLRMQQQKLVVQYPLQLSPFCFPIFAERFREKLSNERIEDRFAKIIKNLER